MADEENLATSGRKRRVLEGVNLVVYTLVVVGIVIVVNVAVSRYGDRRWDLTSTKKFSLSPETLKVLKGLDKNLDIYAFNDARGMQADRDLLDNYTNVTRRVTAHYVDPNREPALAKQFEVRTAGTIVVAEGGRHFAASSADEQGVTNALIRLTKGLKKVCFIGGHGERDLESAERDGFQRFKKGLTDENYTVETTTLLTGKNQIPSDCAVVLIAGPQHDYEPPEIDTLRKYATDGGRVLAMLDAGVETPNLDKLFEGWGAAPQSDLVVDLNPVAQLFNTPPYMPVIVKYGGSPIVEPLKQVMTLFPLTRSFQLSKQSTPDVSDDSLCETSGESFGSMGFNPKIQKISYDASKDVKGPLTVAVSGTLRGMDPKKQGRFVALGTSLIAANAYLKFQGNLDLVMNMVNWLSAEEDLLSIRPKPPEAQHLDLTQAQMRKILFLGVIGVPILIILGGFSVWWQRRR
jgi:gliding motility-associatede transport system auxiliary component